MDARVVKNERIDLRLSKEAKRILQNAAAVKHKTLSEFVIDSSINAAYDTLADRRVFVLDDKRWNAFMKQLSNPPKDNPGLRRLFSHKPRWER
jgi:uncharacterized protein (DUF1778 family)